MASNDDYKVGYKRPPRHSRWKEGQCGYPKGRRKGVRNFKTEVLEILDAPVRVTLDGKTRKISTRAAIVWRLREKALGGDLRAINAMLSLAEAHDGRELRSAMKQVVEDADLVEIFKKRVLSGATSEPDSAAADRTQNDDDAPLAQAGIQTEPKAAPIERVRLIKPPKFGT